MFDGKSIEMMFYYNIGPIIAAVTYYNAQFCSLISKPNRSLFFPEEKFDWWMFVFTVAAFASGISIMILLNINFSLAHKANLNIGITQTVHALQTFFVAFADFLLFSSVLESSQLIGMLIILMCVALVSLEKPNKDGLTSQPLLPVYAIMLFSFTVPIMQSISISVIKAISLRADVREFTFFTSLV
jgi:drug/metabolite transporter (DMT)-like permease